MTQRAKVGVFAAEHNENLLAPFQDTWRRSTSYHEGRHYAMTTPLSLKLAVYNAQQFPVEGQPPVDTDSEAGLDPVRRPEAQAQGQPTSKPPKTGPLGPQDTRDSIDVIQMEGRYKDQQKGYKDQQKELADARYEIKVKNRRIWELEVALQDIKDLVNATTHQVGDKRTRG